MSESRRNEDVRREMLAAIRGHLAASAPHDAVRDEHHTRHADTTPRDGRTRPAGDPSDSLVGQFKRALEEVVGRCVVVGDEAGAASALKEINEKRGARGVAVTDSPLEGRVVGRVRSGAEILVHVDAALLFE